MNNTREAISAALFALLETSNGSGAKQYPFQTFSRAARIWGDVPDGSQPAAFLVKTDEQISNPDAYGAPIYNCGYVLIVYAKADPTSPENSEPMMNQILDAIDYALQSKPIGQPQTLNGIVINAWLEGTAYYDTGILDAQIALVIPIRVRTGT